MLDESLPWSCGLIVSVSSGSCEDLNLTFHWRTVLVASNCQLTFHVTVWLWFFSFKLFWGCCKDFVSLCNWDRRTASGICSIFIDSFTACTSASFDLMRNNFINYFWTWICASVNCLIWLFNQETRRISTLFCLYHHSTIGNHDWDNLNILWPGHEEEKAPTSWSSGRLNWLTFWATLDKFMIWESSSSAVTERSVSLWDTFLYTFSYLMTFR